MVNGLPLTPQLPNSTHRGLLQARADPTTVTNFRVAGRFLPMQLYHIAKLWPAAPSSVLRVAVVGVNQSQGLRLFTASSTGRGVPACRRWSGRGRLRARRWAGGCGFLNLGSCRRARACAARAAGAIGQGFRALPGAFQCVGVTPNQARQNRFRHLETRCTRAGHLVVRTAVGGKPSAAFCSSHLPPMNFPARSGADTRGNVMNADLGAPPCGTVGRFGLWRLRHHTA